MVGVDVASNEGVQVGVGDRSTVTFMVGVGDRSTVTFMVGVGEASPSQGGAAHAERKVAKTRKVKQSVRDLLHMPITHTSGLQIQFYSQIDVCQVLYRRCTWV